MAKQEYLNHEIEFRLTFCQQLIYLNGWKNQSKSIFSNPKRDARIVAVVVV